VTGKEGPPWSSRRTRSTRRRLDDGSRSGYAEIRRQGDKLFVPGDVVTLMPDAIHGVVNETGAVTVSLHTYGMHLNYTGRLDCGGNI
jgi:hypothetical protein